MPDIGHSKGDSLQFVIPHPGTAFDDERMEA